MHPRFLQDENFDARILRGLRRSEPSIDFETASDAGILGLADPDVLRVAADLGRVLVTHDRDTMPTHFSRFIQTQNSGGLVVLAQNLEVGEAIEQLILVWAATSAEEWVNWGGRHRTGWLDALAGAAAETLYRTTKVWSE